MATISDQIITAPVGKFCQVSGVGKTKVYELLGDGTLVSIKVGKRRLIVLDSYRKLMERQGSVALVDQPAAPMPRRRGAGLGKRTVPVNESPAALAGADRAGNKVAEPPLDTKGAPRAPAAGAGGSR
jgi:hypothetical protein